MTIKKNDSWARGTPIEANFYNHKGEPVMRPAKRAPAVGKPLMVDLFCGCGGFSEGFRMAGFQSVLGLDIHPPSMDTFQLNHPEATAIIGDIRRASDEFIVNAVRGRNVDVITAGVPCQGFSLNNRKRHDGDERNFLFKEFIRVVNLLKPPVVLLENVSSLRAAAGGDFARAISEAIAESGYDVDCQVLNAVEFGVPQRRRRVFFIGVRKDLNFAWPAASHGPGLLPTVTVWQAIGDLPQVGPAESATEYDSKPKSDYQRLMRDGARKLLNHEAPNHPPEVIEKIGNTEPGRPMYPRFKQRIRLHPDEPSPTQVSGGIRPQFQFGHPKLPRGLTVRERCRIQSFPDTYEVTGGIVQGRVQTGNAVPPLLAKALAMEIANALRGITKKDHRLSRRRPQMALFA